MRGVKQPLRVLNRPEEVARLNSELVYQRILTCFLNPAFQNHSGFDFAQKLLVSYLVVQFAGNLC